MGIHRLLPIYSCNFFSIRVFFHEHWRLTGQQGKGGGPSFIPLYHFRPLKNIQTIATLHMRWLPRIFNSTTCIYQTATRWDLQPYWICIWLIDDWMLASVCLLDIFLPGFLLQKFDLGNWWIWTRIDYHHRIKKSTEWPI